MSWRRMGVRDQRVEFVIRASRGESLCGLCREYEITRPTGYMWLRRFRERGVSGVEERSRWSASEPAADGVWDRGADRSHAPAASGLGSA
jgi:hypothetical protein